MSFRQGAVRSLHSIEINLKVKVKVNMNLYSASWTHL